MMRRARVKGNESENYERGWKEEEEEEVDCGSLSERVWKGQRQQRDVKSAVLLKEASKEQLGWPYCLH